MFTSRHLLEIAIQVETNGERSYRQAAGETADPTLAEMLIAMADEERKHREWFSDLKNRLSESPADPAVEEMGRDLLRGVIGDRTFSLDEADLAHLPDPAALLEVSAELERDTIAFYEMLEPFLEDRQAGQDLAAVIEEEKNHLKLLRERIEGTNRLQGA